MAGDISAIERLKTRIRTSGQTILGLLDQADQIEEVCNAVAGVLKAGNKVLTAGNGGSAAEALHMTEELTGRFRTNRRSLPAVCLAGDPTALTCIGNDFGFDEVFSRQLEGLGSRDDALVLFSTSGNARNLILALEMAESKGMTVICLLGRDGGALAGRADFEITVSGDETERIQEAHQVIMHEILDAVELAFSVD